MTHGILRATAGALLSTLVVLSFATPSTAAELALEDCRISAGPGTPTLKARCGDFSRPLDPAGNVAGTIELRVAVVPALDLTPELDAVVPIAGGPGQGTIQFYSSYASAFEPLRRNRDIVLVDQRGTGASERLDCAIDDGLTEGQFSAEETVEFTNTCLEELPKDPRFFTTSVAVQDLEAVRIALGYPAFNVYGISYGSRVAQHYARRYPDATRTLIIDGVVPPQLPLGPEIATESQRAVESIFARCIEDSSCYTAFGDIDAAFERVLKTLATEAVTVTVASPTSGRQETLSFGPNELAGGIRLLAYHPSTIAILPLIIAEADKGNFEPLASQYLMTVRSLGEQIALGMHNAVMCTEDAPYYSSQQIDRGAIEASYMGPLLLDAMQSICSVWPSGAMDDDLHSPLSGDTPVLLLSGDADPITPPRYAEMAGAELTNARHIVGKDQGHGQIAVGCMPRLVATFVQSKETDALDAECFERSFVMPFFVDFTGPTP